MSSNLKSGRFPLRVVIYRSTLWSDRGPSSLELDIREGENPVFGRASVPVSSAFEESGCLGSQPKLGGKFHPKLNNGKRPIANKYREGKMKRTLKRELKVREIVKRETIETSDAVWKSARTLVLVHFSCGRSASVCCAG